MASYWLGKKRSEKTKDKIRKTLQKRYSNPKDHPQYIGEIDRGGYWYIKEKGHPFGGRQGYVAKHRLIMEKFLGRFLNPKEVIHHINGNRKDNRIENLELCSSRGQHTKQHHPEMYKRMKIEFKGKRFSPSTEFKKGMTPWNKK